MYGTAYVTTYSIDGFELCDLDQFGDKMDTYIYIYIYIFDIYIHTYIYMSCHILPIDCLLIALDAHMFSHSGYEPGSRAQGPKAAGPGPGGPQLLGLGPGSRPMSIGNR